MLATVLTCISTILAAIIAVFAKEIRSFVLPTKNQEVIPISETNSLKSVDSLVQTKIPRPNGTSIKIAVKEDYLFRFDLPKREVVILWTVFYFGFLLSWTVCVF